MELCPQGWDCSPNWNGCNSIAMRSRVPFPTNGLDSNRCIPSKWPTIPLPDHCPPYWGLCHWPIFPCKTLILPVMFQPNWGNWPPCRMCICKWPNWRGPCPSRCVICWEMVRSCKHWRPIAKKKWCVSVARFVTKTKEWLEERNTNKNRTEPWLCGSY